MHYLIKTQLKIKLSCIQIPLFLPLVQRLPSFPAAKPTEGSRKTRYPALYRVAFVLFLAVLWEKGPVLSQCRYLLLCRAEGVLIKEDQLIQPVDFISLFPARWQFATITSSRSAPGQCHPYWQLPHIRAITQSSWVGNTKNEEKAVVLEKFSMFKNTTGLDH